MVECKSVSTPMYAKNRLLSRGLNEEAALGGISQYQERVGYYQWAESTMRPYITRVTIKLGEFWANPSVIHKNALTHLDHYIRETLDYEIVLGRRLVTNDGGLTVYKEANFAKDSTKKCTSGLLIYD